MPGKSTSMNLAGSASSRVGPMRDVRQLRSRRTRRGRIARPTRLCSICTERTSGSLRTKVREDQLGTVSRGRVRPSRPPSLPLQRLCRRMCNTHIRSRKVQVLSRRMVEARWTLLSQRRHLLLLPRRAPALRPYPSRPTPRLPPLRRLHPCSRRSARPRRVVGHQRYPAYPEAGSAPRPVRPRAAASFLSRRVPAEGAACPLSRPTKGTARPA